MYQNTETERIQFISNVDPYVTLLNLCLQNQGLITNTFCRSMKTKSFLFAYLDFLLILYSVVRDCQGSIKAKYTATKVILIASA